MKNVLLSVLSCFAVVSVLLSACSNHGNNGTYSTETITTETSAFALSEVSPVWEIDPSHGGYAFDTDSLSCKLVVDGEEQYSRFASATNDHIIEFYISPTEMIVINTLEGVTTYYCETYDDSECSFTNPMVRIFEEMKLLEFESSGEITLDGTAYQEYCAAETVQKQTTPKVEYTLYTIQTKWIDDEMYLFQYCVYADGATLFIGDAPDEIDPLVTADTTWIMDLDSMQIFDCASDTGIPIHIVETSSGEGVSPWSEEKITVEIQHFTYIYVDPQTQRIEKFQMVKDSPGAIVSVLYSSEIEKPVITNEMTVMDDDTLETAIWLISMLDELF